MCWPRRPEQRTKNACVLGPAAKCPSRFPIFPNCLLNHLNTLYQHVVTRTVDVLWVGKVSNGEQAAIVIFFNPAWERKGFNSVHAGRAPTLWKPVNASSTALTAGAPAEKWPVCWHSKATNNEWPAWDSQLHRALQSLVPFCTFENQPWVLTGVSESWKSKSNNVTTRSSLPFYRHTGPHFPHLQGTSNYKAVCKSCNCGPV